MKRQRMQGDPMYVREHAEHGTALENNYSVPQSLHCYGYNGSGRAQ
jgi:hypothetical protein